MVKKNTQLFTALVYILVGVLLVIFQSQTLAWAMTIAGAIFVIFGALDLLKKNFMGGAISMIIGIAILVLGWVAVGIVLLVLGILIAVKGVFALLEVFKKANKSSIDFIFPALTIALGALLAFGNGLNIIIIIVGVLLAIDGVLALLPLLKK